MAETRTSRFGLVQWGVGTDSPSRLDFNEAFKNLEDRAAYDDGETYGILPVTNVVQGRYVSVVADGRRTLYRRSEEGTWDFAGGSTVPETLTLRPPASGAPAIGDNALVLSHPDLASAPGAQWAWDGSLTVGGTMRVFDGNDPVKGTVIVGASLGLAADPVANGRLHVRTRANSERGLVIRAHAETAGSLLAIQESGGSDSLTVDSTGRLQQRTASAFGGAAVSTSSSMAIAPTSNSSDSITNGLVLYGHAAPADTKTIMRVLRQADDSAEILSIGRDALTLGRLPWGSSSSGGTLGLSGRQLHLRASGYSGDSTLWKLTRADISDPANTTLDEAVLTLGRTLATQRVPTVLTQALGTGGVNLTLKRYTDLTQRFLELQRMGAGETSEVVGSWDSEGRILSGTRWIGTGVTRDARQQLRHRTQKNQASLLDPGQTLTTVFATMQSRSGTSCDLAIDVRLQAQVEVGAFSDMEDGQQWFLNCDISVNGGGFTFIGSYLMGGPSHRNGTRPTVVQSGDFQLLNLPAGATFQIRTRVFVGGAVPKITVQAQFVNVTESVITNYTS